MTFHTTAKAALLLMSLTVALTFSAHAEEALRVAPDTNGGKHEIIANPQPATCDYESVIGQNAEEVDKSVFPDDAFIRILTPGQAVTMEYREGRINLNVDDDGIIISVTCG